LIVGVGAYANDKVPDLDGPPNDARRIYDTLTAADGYAFPARNVCLLLNENATTARFEEAVDRGLVQRAAAGDTVVIFFAGHGSQTKDRNGDEPDQWDETLLFHDARVAGQRDLVDDRLNGMLAAVHAKTSNVVLILDSCNSGTATRGDSGLVARFFEPDEAPDAAAGDTNGDGDGAWGGASLPGLVALTAASDGTPALESAGQGIFTTALIRVLADGRGGELTYAQLARQVPPLVAARSYQIPYFQGDLQRSVFGIGGAARRPLGWDVVTAGSTLRLSGPPLPGVGIGAELQVYDGGITGSPNPSAAKATAVITALTGVNAEARVTARVADAPAIEAGDLAILVRPADEYLKIKLGLRPADRPGGIPAARAAAIRQAIAAHPEARMLVDVVQQGGEFEVSTAFDGGLELRGPENKVRNTLRVDTDVPDALWRHARQRALLQLRGEGGADFVDNETLRVRLVPAALQPPCADGEWVQAVANEDQVVPLCHRFNIEVSLAADAPKSVLIGALVLSTDGSTFGLPRDGSTLLLKPGETTNFNATRLIAGPPLDTRDQILVFGTQEQNPVAWNLLTQTAATRSGETRGSVGALYRTLDRYLQPGMRGIAEETAVSTPTTWTMTSIGMRVEANSRFLQPRQAGGEVLEREYTIKGFDIRPYLPDDPGTALRTVLDTADSLARASANDGYSYKQHDWSQATDDANLRVGIDCSRSIWYAFTRSGLPYNRNDRYLTTSQMVSPDSVMADEFEQCPANEEHALGDILVYRSDDPQRNDGHVVMVIDPQKRIAWGSHGWDGEGRTPGVVPDTGVEYQLIKFKPDWQRWDRADMSLKMCWRYRQFADEAENGRGTPGVAAVSAVCSDQACRL